MKKKNPMPELKHPEPQSKEQPQNQPEQRIHIDITLLEQGIDTDNRIIMLEGQIDARAASRFSRSMLILNFSDPKRPINVVIDSNGGDVYSALEIYDFIKCSTVPVYTIGKRAIMSSALLLLAAGEKGKRALYPHTSLMVHGGSMGLYGKNVDVEDSFAHLKTINNSFDKLLCQNSKFTKKMLDNISKSGRDFYLTPAQAIKHGLADCVLRGR